MAAIREWQRAARTELAQPKVGEQNTPALNSGNAAPRTPNLSNAGGGPDSVVEADGPISPSKLRWKGKETELQPVPHKLLVALWKSPGRKLEAAAAERAVWGNELDSDSALKAASTRVNRALSEVGCMLTVRLKAGHVSLE